MNPASLFNLQGPDLFVILIIVLLLFGVKKLPDRELGDREKRPALGDKFSAINRVLLMIAVISGMILLSVLLSGE